MKRKEDLSERYIKYYDTINRCAQEYREANREYLKKKGKILNKINYRKNKEKILAKRKEYKLDPIHAVQVRLTQIIFKAIKNKVIVRNSHCEHCAVPCKTDQVVPMSEIKRLAKRKTPFNISDVKEIYWLCRPCAYKQRNKNK